MNCLRGFGKSITEQAPEPRSSLPPRRDLSQTCNFQPCGAPLSPFPPDIVPLTSLTTPTPTPGSPDASPAVRCVGGGPTSSHRAGVQCRLSRARTTFPTRQLKSCAAEVIRRSRMDNLHHFCAGVSQNASALPRLVFL